MSIFLIGAVGLAIDGAQLYAHRQMAQTAADAAAQAGIMSIFDGTNATGANAFAIDTPPSSFTCSTTDGRSPCVYARQNGFGGSASDQVTVSFPTSAPGVNLSASDPVNLIKVTVQRTLTTGLIRFVGPSLSTIKASGTAAIIDVVSPIPIIVTHPTMSGSLSSNGNPAITICGGPARSIQVNSSSSTAVSLNSNTTIDLSKAGPNDPGNCSTGTGADFGVWGGPVTKPTPVNTGSTGHYIQPASPILDPLADVSPPLNPGGTNPVPGPLSNGDSGCPASPRKPCMLYAPGQYIGGIPIVNQTAVFLPGIYYIVNGNFGNGANGDMYMATGRTDPVTGWTGNMLVYMTGNGTFDLTANATANLVGSPANSAYKGILFFKDRTSPANIHQIGSGGSQITLSGTLYITNSLAIMKATPSQYQTVSLQGNSGSNTTINGEIITRALTMGGGPAITMNLNAGQTVHVRQVALVQ